MTERRLKIYRVSPELILERGRKGSDAYEVVKDAIPDDGCIVDVKWDGNIGAVDFIVHSNTFKKLNEGESPSEYIIPICKLRGQ